MRGIGVDPDKRVDGIVYATALGLGCLAHLVFLLGAIGGLYQWAIWILIGTGLVSALHQFYTHRNFYLTRIRGLVAFIVRNDLTHWFNIGLLVLVIIACLFPLLANALMPPTGWDEVAYHLAVPKIYTQTHTLTYLPSIPHSNWPFEAEALYTLSLLIGSERLAQLFTWLALLLTCAGLFLFSQRFINAVVGGLAASLFAVTPMVVHLSGTAMVELLLTLFSLFAVLTWLEWVLGGKDGIWRLSAVFAGLAACVKLNAVTIPILLGIATMGMTMIRQRNQWRIALKQFILYGLIALAVVAPWYLKAWIQTGNPVWPFFFAWFGGKNWDNFGTGLFEGFIRQPNMVLNFWNWLTGFWQVTWQPYRFGSVTLGWHYLIFLPVGLLGVGLKTTPIRKQILYPLGLLIVAFYTVWFFQTHQTRFLMPTMSMLALFLAIGLGNLWSWQRRRLNYVIQGMILVAVGLVGWWSNPVDRTQLSNSWPYLSGQISRNQYLKRQIPGYEAFLFINKSLPSNARVWMAVWESRGYYLDREYLWANPVSQRMLPMENIKDADQLSQELQSLGVTHILFSTVFLERFAYIPSADQVTNLVRQLLADHARLLFRSEPIEIYQLSP